MSDKITHVKDVTPKGKAWLAAMERVDANLASAIADAIEAYDRERTVVAVRLLRVQPGDIVVFHFIEPLSAQEHGEFLKAMAPLGETHPDVRFLATEGVDDVTVVRGPEYALGRQEQPERLRVELETLEAQELMSECAKPTGFWTTASSTIEGVGEHGTIASAAHRCIERGEHTECRCSCGATNTQGGGVDG